MPERPSGYVERLEENESYLMAACADLKNQLAEAVGIIRQLSGRSRDEINTQIAAEIRRKKCESGDTTS